MKTTKGAKEVTATLANMKRLYKPGVFAYSPRTGEEYSANPGDYWTMGQDDVLKDAEGKPMVLVTASRTIRPA